MMLARLVSPTVGLNPTTELLLAEQMMGLVALVPSETVAMLVATNIADPLLEPCGSLDSMYGFCMHEILCYKLFMSNSCSITFNISKK